MINKEENMFEKIKTVLIILYTEPVFWATVILVAVVIAVAI